MLFRRAGQAGTARTLIRASTGTVRHSQGLSGLVGKQEGVMCLKSIGTLIALVVLILWKLSLILWKISLIKHHFLKKMPALWILAALMEFSAIFMEFLKIPAYFL